MKRGDTVHLLSPVPPTPDAPSGIDETVAGVVVEISAHVYPRGRVVTVQFPGCVLRVFEGNLEVRARQ